MSEHVYTCILKDGNKRIILQPFIAYDDNAAFNTIKNAIRDDKGIRAIAMQERISLHKLCDIEQEQTDHFTVMPYDIEVYVGDNVYFRTYAQMVYADEARQEANEAEAEVMSDPETKETFYNEQCESTQIFYDEFMKGEVESD